MEEVAQMRGFIICTHLQIALGRSSQGTWHAWERRVYRVLVGQPKGRRPFGRPRRKWEDGIRMDLREIVCGVWIGFDRLRIGTGGELL
jgi:hypothetical protein